MHWYHPYLICILFPDTEVITCHLDSQWVAQGGYHFNPYWFTGYATHLHKGQLEITFFMALNHGFGMWR